MANTGVLPFVRGIDFTNNDFSVSGRLDLAWKYVVQYVAVLNQKLLKQDGRFPNAVRLMSGIQWLKLDKTKLNEIPEEMSNLMKLEHLSLKNNQLENFFFGTELACLHSLNLRHNNIKSSGVPPELFDLEELTTIDLSHNKLKEVPDGLSKAKSLLVLNLSYNQIDSIPNSLFIHLTDLLFLDLSHNKLETLPPQTRRLTNLQTLILSNNPLELFQLRQLPSLQSLEVLHMSNTQRTIQNFPATLDSLSNLVELDLSRNALQKVPQCLYNMPNLRRLNLSGNDITELSPEVEFWKKIEVLNLSRNKLTALPQMLCKLSQLRRLFLNDNLLNFDGIPGGIGKLCNLEIFSASNNHLEMIPEGLCRCGALKKLNLSTNRLITLPDAIHLLSDLDQLDLRNNPNLIMPPKPAEIQKGSGVEFYNIDFSLQHQLRIAGASVPPSIASAANTPKDSTARKIRLRRGLRNDSNDNKDSAKILKGMKDIAKDKDLQSFDDDPVIESLKPKRWDESLEKPPVDYSEIFEDDDGQIPGLTIWEIENFLPNKIDQVIHGKFYQGDCYIILKTYIDDNGQLTWQIYFWIGAEATLDKRACSAIHAVNLRNYLGARCRTIREEQNDESEEFLALFDTTITYIEGGRTVTGFYTVEDVMHNNRMYRIHGAGSSIHLEPVPVEVDSFDPRYVFLIDTSEKIFMWYGRKSKNTIKSKARLFAEKINKNERKSKMEIIMENQCEESDEFTKLFLLESRSEFDPIEHVDSEFVPAKPTLYQVQLGMGYLELPQVGVPQQKMVHTLLNSKNVYILDCKVNVFVWFGKKSTRLVRAAALKLSQELFNMINRPEYATITRIQEGNETQFFKTNFVGWEEIIAVDFTRTAQSVAKTGADLSKWARQQETRADLAALFMPRQPPMTTAEAKQLEEDWNYDLEAMECLVLEDKKFVRLPEEEFGIFYSGDCYVFFCKYVIPPDEEDENVEQAAPRPAPTEDEIQCIVYFWQGRDAGNMGWLTFTFTLQKKFKAMFSDELEVIRIHQQQENLKFMAHFKRKFIIKTGKRKEALDPSNDKKDKVEFYHLRSNGSALCTRLIQISTDASHLNSAFCYILFVPFESSDNEKSGIVYVWIGSKSTPEESKIIQEIAEDMFNNPWVSLQILNEGEEPENFFWVALGGRKPYDEEADFMQYSRLFRCSNEKGYFTVAEKCSDFCQDDLADDDIMLLDNGEQVFLWLGSRCSEVEIKLAYKSAQVYIQHMRIKQPQLQRKLFLTLKNKESKRFTKCFHGWTQHKKQPD